MNSSNTGAPEAAQAATLEAFDRRAAEQYLRGQWIAEEHLMRAIGGPRPAGIPYRWEWKSVEVALDEATIALGPVDTARRHLTFVNPGLMDRGSATTHTISAGFQLVKPGEVCWSHRHTMSAVRFVTKGHPDAFTAVDGERLPMEDFDLLITPRFSWHDHHNSGDADVVWLDGLDIGLLQSLGAVFYEPYGDDSQNVRPSSSEGIGTRSHWLRPTWERGRESRLPIRYPWKEVNARLDVYDLDAGTPYDGLALRYANPVTGGPTMATMDCWVQRLAPGFDGKSHRRSSSAITYVISGSGTMVTEDETITFNRGDVISLPNWTNFRWTNDSEIEPVLLFSMHDIPALEAFGLLYEEPEAILNATPAPINPTPSLNPIYRPGAFYDQDEL
uniref:1-hydroxy-2-naphthoate 1,2-dioxygenasee n=1 Tax=Nocardioides sp. (strain KP7) TaxID=102632 RepID=PHDI_NOCSK|nr:RecName: Full=1-hydroxy-2-naphthoate 1,2-dioxygenasee; AltName: Full=1-hydroxy-2-naphthoate-degrading enzyme; AltName: Full=1-hydroxy-2-naphthoic acid dioxygenase [Nocardioides sp. KP7]BAA31235.2 1-hydroxy-2-naphthoate dioxygenase [Nocardioides sp. KP7]